MKKIKSALSMAILGLSMAVTHYASADNNAPTADEKIIVVGTQAFAKPFVFKENEKLTGFDIDVTLAVAAKAGYQVQFAEYDWSGIFGALDSGRIDTIAHQISVNEVRKQKYDFSQPYAYSNESIIVPADDKTTASLKDLKGKVVLVAAGTSEHILANKLAPEYGFTVKAIANNEAGELLEVANKRVDAYVTDSVQFALRVKEQGLQDKVKTAFAIQGQQALVAFPFSKKNTGKYHEFNQALGTLLKDGTIKKISEKWLGRDVTVSQ